MLVKSRFNISSILSHFLRLDLPGGLTRLGVPNSALCKFIVSSMRATCQAGLLLITVRSRFTTGLRSRIFGFKSSRRKTSTI
jgi:hypothetical protein